MCGWQWQEQCMRARRLEQVPLVAPGGAPRSVLVEEAFCRDVRPEQLGEVAEALGGWCAAHSSR